MGWQKSRTTATRRPLADRICHLDEWEDSGQEFSLDKHLHSRPLQIEAPSDEMTKHGCWPVEWQLHGNHFHEETEERLDVISGQIVCYLRRATLVEEIPDRVILTAGQSLIVKPGWTHLYCATRPRSVVNIRGWSLDGTRTDVIEDLLFAPPSSNWRQ